MDKYLRDDQKEKEIKKEEQKKKKEIVSIWNVFGGFKDTMGKIKGVFRYIGPTKSKESFEVEQVKNAAQESALKLALTAYDIYKKGHGMVTW